MLLKPMMQYAEFLQSETLVEFMECNDTHKDAYMQYVECYVEAYEERVEVALRNVCNGFARMQEKYDRAVNIANIRASR